VAAQVTARGTRAPLRVLVTGGAGFIGGHLCRALSRAGALVEVWRQSESGGPPVTDALPNLEVHQIDVRVREAVASALAARPPDRVFHLAGVRLLGNRADNLARMFETHVLGALHVIESVPADARVVVVGSCEEYGRAPVPFRETQAAEPQTAYGITRLATTLACQALAAPPVCIARLAVVYGPGQTGEMFVPSLLAACVARRPFAMTDGRQTRDFLYVEDAVEALLALAETPAAMGQIVNVGSGAGRPAFRAGRRDQIRCHPIAAGRSQPLRVRDRQAACADSMAGAGRTRRRLDTDARLVVAAGESRLTAVSGSVTR
jgi:nucleoside-diphosphate-sugar epimerase